MSGSRLMHVRARFDGLQESVDKKWVEAHIGIWLFSTIDLAETARYFLANDPAVFSRDKINKSLCSFDIKRRTVRPYPVFLQASLKGVLKSLSRGRLVWSFFSHNDPQFQTVIVNITLWQ